MSVLRRISQLPAAAIFIYGWAFAADVQPDPTPRLIVNTGGPAGRITALGFSADSSRLYAAGTDKVVHAWHIERGAAAGQLQSRPLQPLRWEIARGDRGHIYAMALSPVGEELAAGGVGMRGPRGDIVVFDTAVTRVHRVLPQERSKDPVRNPLGHWSPVHRLEFSPDGTALLSISGDNEMRLWRKSDRWQSILLRGFEEYEVSNPAPAVFVDNDRIVAAETVKNRPALVEYQWNPSNSPRRRLLRQLSGSVTALAAQPETGLLVSAESTGAVTVQSPTGTRLLRSRGGTTTVAMAFGPGDLLALANRGTGAAASGIQLYDVKRSQQVAAFAETQGRVSCLAISPDGQWLASSTEDGQSVTVRAVPAGAEQKDRTAATQISGHGRNVRYVSFSSEDPDLIAVDTAAVKQPGANTFYFHLTRNRLMRRTDLQQWRTPLSDGKGWSVDFPGSDGSLLEFRFQGIRRGLLRINTKAQGQLRSSCLIPDERGQPVAAAVATAGSPGIFVYSLPSPGQPPRLLRWYREHTNDINVLSVSRDGRYLVSGSADQTVRIFSLAGLARQSAFPQASVWGADFVERSGRLTVENVDPAGIAYARGMRDGDFVERVKCILELSGKTLEVDTQRAPEMLDALSRNLPFHEMTVAWRRDSQKFERVIVAGWESLLTLFVDDRDEWVLFTPSGHFTSSAAEGHGLTSWQFNRGPGLSPRMVHGGDLRRQLERPLLIRNILKVGSFSGAVQAVRADPLSVSVDTAKQVSEGQPELVIDLPRLDRVHAANSRIPVSASIRVPAGRSPHEYSVRAYANGLPVPVIVASDGTVSGVVKAEHSLSRLRMLVYQDETLVTSSEVSFRVAATTPHLLRVHYLILGANQYSGAFAPLKFGVADAVGVEQLLKDGQGPLYALMPQTCIALHDQQVSRAAVSSAIDKLVQQLSSSGPDDLLIVHLAGHGAVVDDEFYFVPPAVTLTNDVAGKAIPWSEFLRVASLPCRKLVMIDACKGGATIAADNGDDEKLKAAMRPLIDSGMVVLSAVNRDQDAFEVADLGHGIFTDSFLRGFAGPADGRSELDSRDGIIGLREAAAFVMEDVPSRLTKRNLYQQPTIAPRALIEVLDTRLIQLK